MSHPVGVKPRYDWRACAIAVVVGMAVATPTGLAVASLFKSTLLLSAVITVVGTAVSKATYARVAKAGSRPIEDEESCPR